MTPLSDSISLKRLSSNVMIANPINISLLLLANPNLVGENPFEVVPRTEIPPIAIEMLPVGGHLYHFQDRWTFSPWAHSVVSNGLGWEWDASPPPLRPFYQRETQVLRENVSKMSSKGVIEECQSLRFQGRLFSVPKRDSAERRVILDLSYLNKFVRCD